METSRLSRNVADQKLIDGVEGHMSQLASVPVGGQSMTPADIVAFLQARIDAAKAVEGAKAALAAALKADRDVRAKTSASRSALCRMVVGMFMHSPDVLATFGVSAPKPATTSVAARAVAIAKGKATREARHTMGKKQKQRITGSLDGATSAAPVAPEAAAKPTA